MNTKIISSNVIPFLRFLTPKVTLTGVECSKLRDTIIPHFNPLDTILRKIVIPDKSEETLLILRNYLDIIEVEKNDIKLNDDTELNNSEYILTGGALVRMGIQYSSILLFMYGKFVSNAFGTISGDDCLLATSIGNEVMINFIGIHYQLLANNFITAKPNDFTVSPKSIEYLFYCYQGAYNAKYFKVAKIFYNRMKVMKNFDAERMCC